MKILRINVRALDEIAPERENIFYSRRAKRMQHIVYSFRVGIYTCQVSKRDHALRLYMRCEIKRNRLLLFRASRAVCDADIRGVQFRDLLRGGIYRVRGDPVVRRENLERQMLPAFQKEFRDLHLFISPLSQIFNIFLADEFDSVRRKQLCSSVVVLNAEHNARVFARNGYERVHIFDIHTVVGKKFYDLGQRARSVIDGDRGDFRYAYDISVIRQDFLRLFGVADNKTKDTEILCVGYRHRADIYSRVSENFRYFDEFSRLVFNEDG